jgi:ubiquinone/menaquinone biosynthesis C-methylase UbiE
LLLVDGSDLMSQNAANAESLTNAPDAIQAQRDYYRRTANEYDHVQISSDDEHAIALGWMVSLIEQKGYLSLLDVGSGTGRALAFVKNKTNIALRGIEPSQDLRNIGHQKGISPDVLTDGDALALPFDDSSFDIVCAFGVLHHIKDHKRAVSEMQRVAAKAVFISDANNFGQGKLGNRVLKQVLNALGLWKLVDSFRTGFKGYHYSEGDGIFYSYSIFDDLPLLKSKFPDLLFMSTRPSGANLYRAAQTLAVFAARQDAMKGSGL